MASLRAKAPNLAQAKRLQQELRAAVRTDDDFGPVRAVAGTDVGFADGGATARGAVVLLSFPGLELLERVLVARPVDFPYIPGYLSFRELPVLLDALARLRRAPDLVLCDGQGRAHPRRFGIACHLGVVTGLPSVGVAKSRLIGSYREPARGKGSASPLLHDGERIGTVLRSRAGVSPLFVSGGHRVSLAAAQRYALACCTRYRLPETTRAAHRLASGWRRPGHGAP